MRAEHRDELARVRAEAEAKIREHDEERRETDAAQARAHQKQIAALRADVECAEQEGRVAEEVRRTRQRLEQLLAAVEHTSAVAAGLESAHVLGAGVHAPEGVDDGQQQDNRSLRTVAADVRASGAERASSLLSELETRADADRN